MISSRNVIYGDACAQSIATSGEARSGKPSEDRMPRQIQKRRVCTIMSLLFIIQLLFCAIIKQSKTMHCKLGLRFHLSHFEVEDQRFQQRA